ncbi:nitrous oxide-stimulated promoter family protein [Adlercreutzia sp. ZJ242]|uniref:nitrous oxide-stimulated promoter family protein n=1 Tax=Adlercreutzia sp. ZJ242 TaxID=2709409 RepID=UPI0013E9EAD9|nr:nitrous oxide-stimulated promoter family protein [Adlercreutzia sp. ZJ242]
MANVSDNHDTPAVAKRREREMRTISQMIALYCASSHAAAERTETAHCGEAVCPACAALDAYAVARTRGCRKMDVKTSCDECENRCYRAAEREQICAVMRFAGPRMITKHPIAAVRHLLGK